MSGRLALDNEFPGRGLKPVDRGLGSSGASKCGEPLVGVRVGDHDRGRFRVPFDNGLVEVGGLGRVKGLEREVIEDKKIARDKSAHLDVVGVIKLGGAEVPL